MGDLKSFMTTRFKRYFDKDDDDFDPIFIVAAALDPRTINVLQVGDFNTAVKYIEEMV